MTKFKSRHYSAGHDVLHIPLAVNVRGLSGAHIDCLMDTITTELGARYFRDKVLLLDVLRDQVDATKQPGAFLYGPYIKLAITGKGELRIASCNNTKDGDTVYAYDQFFDLVSALDREKDGSLQIPEESVRSVGGMGSLKYVVLNEHTLCYKIEATPLSLGVLAGSVLKGGHDWKQGTCAVLPGHDRVRPATRADFADFLVQVPSDFDDARMAPDDDEGGPRP